MNQHPSKTAKSKAKITGVGLKAKHRRAKH